MLCTSAHELEEENRMLTERLARLEAGMEAIT